MEVVAYINQNLPIWSILCGDHALVEEVKLINENLIKNPKLESTLENKLRHSIFKHKRAFIDETIKNTASFALVSLSFEELMDENLVQTCFTEISFKRFAVSFKTGGKKKYAVAAIIEMKERYTMRTATVRGILFRVITCTAGSAADAITIAVNTTSTTSERI
jgi:hypothetical protein